MPIRFLYQKTTRLKIVPKKKKKLACFKLIPNYQNIKALNFVDLGYEIVIKFLKIFED